MICTHYNHLTHLHFTNKITGSFRQQKCEREGFFFCASIEVPFDKIRDELNTNVERDENYTREHLEKLDELNKHKYLSPKYQINVIYIRRVSIHDKPNKLWRYYTIRSVAEKWQIFNRICYTFRLWNRNGDVKHGGGVGIYIRIYIKFEVLNDISKLNESIEHLWVKIEGRKKNSASLKFSIFYWPSSENNKKIEWIEKQDSVLSVVKSTWRDNHNN